MRKVSIHGFLPNLPVANSEARKVWLGKKDNPLANWRHKSLVMWLEVFEKHVEMQEAAVGRLPVAVARSSLR